MSEEINFNKTVFNKAQYIKTIDTSFSELGVTTSILNPKKFRLY